MQTNLAAKAQKIKLMLTDCDGVLTDNGVYYTQDGEMMKRFSIRDGMGVERLRNEVGVATGIITGETSGSVIKRAEKLNIEHLYLGIKNKKQMLSAILEETRFVPAEIAYIGDDVNDIEIMNECGLTACPSDAMFQVKDIVDYVCNEKGGHGAFREFAEFIIKSKKL